MTSDALIQADDTPENLGSEIRTAVGLSLGAAVALGLSRFAYGLLLPPMRAELGWSYVEAGALNTANGVGYIAGALVAAALARRWGAARAFIGGYVVSVLILLLTAHTSSLPMLFALRSIGGLSTAVTFILGAGLAAAICPRRHPHRRGLLVGIYVAGVSVSMVVAGLIIPWVLRDGSVHWPMGWTVLGLLGLAGLPLAGKAAYSVSGPSGGSLAILGLDQFRQLAPTFTGYSLFGAGYVGYMTFIIALLQKQGGNSQQMMWFWLVLGSVSAVSTLAWGRILGHMPGGRGPALVFATAMLGTLPVLVHPGPWAALLSAVLFGGSFLAGPTSITIVAQRQLPAASWTAAISLLTVGFAFGQTIGPVVAGAISDSSGSIAAGFWVSPLLLAAAALVSLRQRPAHA